MEQQAAQGRGYGPGECGRGERLRAKLEQLRGRGFRGREPEGGWSGHPGRGRHAGFGGPEAWGGRGPGGHHPWGGEHFGARGFGRPGGHGFGGHGFGGPGGPGFGGGRRGGGRMFGGGDLRYVILRLLDEQPSHGYELIKAIGERMGGGYAPSPGVIYPMLTMLEEMGHATVTAEGSRKLYAITDEGKKALAENREMVDAIFARMDRMREAQGGEGAPQIERAIANFRMALRMRMGALTAEQTHAVVDIIDAAAKQIERLGQ